MTDIGKFLSIISVKETYEYLDTQSFQFGNDFFSKERVEK